MNNYEYIIASLPAISTDWKFTDKGPDQILEEILNLCSESDRKVIDVLLEGLSDEMLTRDFYIKAASHRNRFIREYFLFDMNVRNAKVKYLNTALGRPADKDIMDLPSGEFEEAARIEGILSGSDILVRERAIDDLMWDKISEITVFNYFDINAILAFIAKLHIVARWYKLDEASGREMFRKLVNEVRGTFKGVEYEADKAR